MSENPNDEETLFAYTLDPETESDEQDEHRARFAGLTLERYRVMRAYAAFKQHRLQRHGNSESDPGD